MAASGPPPASAETLRLAEAQARTAHWKRWGPYLAERQWGTVREDYSPHGTAWDYFPHDHARSRAYRWGEDGLLGISDNHQRLCFALALWNGRDPILKERLFGLTGPEGNHGEDVKEYYFYLDATPTHSYMRALYKYPQHEYPYARLVEENARRGRDEARVRAPRHRRLRRRPLLRRGGGVREGEPERHPGARDRRQPGSGGGAAHRAADALVPEHLGLGARRAEAAPGPGPSPGRRHGRAGGASGALAGISSLRRRDAASPLHRERDRRPAPVRRRPARCRTEGRLPRGARPRPGRSAPRGRGGDEGRGPPPARDSGGRPGGPAAPARRRAAGGALRAGVRPRLRRAPARGRRVLRDRDSGSARRGRAERHAPGAGGDALVEAVVPLRRPALARGRPRPAAAAAGASPRPERRVGPSLQRRRRVDAGQVGVSLVRGLGSRVPHDRAGAGRSRLREGPAHPVPPRMVHAPERPDSRLRVGARGREPAGSRLGGLACLQDREAHPGRRRSAVPRARLPEAAPELHLVGEPQGPRGEERLPGGLPRPRQHRASSTARRRCPSAATSSSPTAPRGSGCTA